MCGRVNLAGLSSRELFEWLELGKPPAGTPEIPSRWNVPPTSDLPILRRPGGTARLDLARWWFIPHWHRGTLSEFKATTFNARVETAATSPTFRDAWRRARCVVPVSGYYEWQKRGTERQPYYIRPAGNAPALLLAGLWSSVRLPDFEGLTCTILTETAPEPMSRIHGRMPVILSPDHALDWPEGADMPALPRLGLPGLAWHPVTRAVGSVRNDGPELIEPIEA